MSIPTKPEKIKGFKGYMRDETLFVSLLLIMVALASFWLGRLSMEENTAKIGVSGGDQNNVAAVVITGPEEAEAASVVASKNSDKYHLPWCSGAQNISESNKIWFSSKEEAEAAGYEPAGNCKGI